MFNQIRKYFLELASSIHATMDAIHATMDAIHSLRSGYDSQDASDAFQARYYKEVRGSLKRKDARRRGLVGKPKKPP